VIAVRLPSFPGLSSRVFQVLVGAVLAVATLVVAGLLLIHVAFGDSSEYCTSTVKARLTTLLDEIRPPSGVALRRSYPPECADSVDDVAAARSFTTRGAGGSVHLLAALRAELDAHGWSCSGAGSGDLDAAYARRVDGKDYWAELRSGHKRVLLAINAGDAPD
jgi:hypothetical protein